MDFIMYYGTDAREMDALLLLKAELAKRGYTAEIVHYRMGRRWCYHRFIHTRASVVQGLFNDWMLSEMVGGRIAADKVINLQWDQVIISKENSILRLGGKLRLLATHLCWGYKCAEWLRETGVAAERVWVTGALHLDLCAEPFWGYYRTKAELADETGLNPSKRWLLFVSNFAYVDEGNTWYKSEFGGVIAYNRRVLFTILAWVKQYCEENPDVEFIFRPHPLEELIDALAEMTVSVKNFHFIREGAAREWVLVSDVCFVHNTTTVAEIYAAKKTCGVLRPEPCLEEYDSPIYDGCRSIETYEDFVCCCEGEDKVFPVKEETIRSYYDHRVNWPAYQRICDVMEEIITREESGPEAIALIQRSDDETARSRLCIIDLIAIISELFRYGEFEAIGAFLRVISRENLAELGWISTYLRDWPKLTVVPEKQRRLCQIIGAPELPDEPYLERAIEAHRQGETWEDFDGEGYDRIDRMLAELEKSDAPTLGGLLAVLRDLLPYAEFQISAEEEQFGRFHTKALAAAMRRLLRCEPYPSDEEAGAELYEAKKVILYGMGRYVGSIKQACDDLNVQVACIWDRRADEIEMCLELPVKMPFGEQPDERMLVVNALNQNQDFYPVWEELREKGYRVMDGRTVCAFRDWRAAWDAK